MDEKDVVQPNEKGTLTSAQLDRMACVDNTIQALLEELAGHQLDYDGELNAEIRDIVREYFARENIMTPMEFYPFVAEQPSDEDIADRDFLCSICGTCCKGAEVRRVETYTLPLRCMDTACDGPVFEKMS